MTPKLAFAGFLVLIMASPARLSARPLEEVPAISRLDDVPAVTAFNVAPGILKDNRINFVHLVFRFKDEGKNLYGGLVTINFIYAPAQGAHEAIPLPSRPLFVPPSEGYGAVRASLGGGRTQFVTYPLNHPVFKNAAGEFHLYFGLLAESFSSVAIDLWLRDGDGHNGPGSRSVVLTRSTSPSGEKQGFKVGQPAYNFTLPDKANNRKTLSNYRGKVVLIDFSTMWCGPCRVEAAELEALYQKYRSRGFIILNVLMENYGSGPIRTSDALKWARTYGLTFPVLADTFWGVFDPYYAFPGVRRIPNNILLDKAGVIRLKKLGFTATVKAQLEAKIQQLLDE